MKIFKIELTDNDENLQNEWICYSRQSFVKTYNQLIQQKNDGILWSYTGDDIDNLQELEEKRFYYEESETPKARINNHIFKYIIYFIIYLIITPFAVLLKLGKK